MYNLGDVIKTLIEIERVSKKSYVILAAGETDEERNKFNHWTLIGTSILLTKEWKQLFKEIKFSGDYYFSSIKSLKGCILVEVPAGKKHPIIPRTVEPSFFFTFTA